VEIWDPWRPALVASADAWRYPYALAWSPDGSVLASLTGYDYRFDQYDLPPELEGMRHFAKLQVWRIVPAPDGFAAMILLAHALVPRDADISLAGCLSWSPDSMGVAVGTGSVDFFSLVPVPSRLGALGFPDKPGVMVWFLGPGWELVPEAYLEGPARWVSCVSWSLDGSRIVAGSNDGTIGVWVAPKLPIVEGPKQSFAAILIAVGMFVKVVASLFREGMARFSYGRDACQLSSKATSSPESHP